RTRRPSVAIFTPSRVTDSTSFPPSLETTARTVPVSTVIRRPVSVTDTLFAPVAEAPGPRVNRSAPAASGPTACAVHLREPSGQRAVVQVCTGTGAPSAVVSANVRSPGCTPLGQATPKVDPAAAPSPPGSSHATLAGRS